MTQKLIDNNNDTIIKHTDTEMTVTGSTSELIYPEQVYMHEDKIQPRLITKDASYSFIWIDDHIKSLSNYHQLMEDKHIKKSVTKRGFCTLFTIFFIFAILLFLLVYPFITVFYKSSSSSSL